MNRRIFPTTRPETGPTTQRAENGTEVLDQSRVNNQDNQVTQIDGSSDGIAYDKAGNATKLPPGADGEWSKHFQLKWDGWNRLVEIRR